MEFRNKFYLYLLLLVIPYIVWYVKTRKKREASFRISDTRAYNSIHKTIRQRLVWLPYAAGLIAMCTLILSIARPQSRRAWGKSTVEGIDIMLAIDVSTSMLAKDLAPNRIEAAKKVAAEFISRRTNDNIGLTIFAGESFTPCPPTLDHKTLISQLQHLDADIAARQYIEDGTAVGMGLVSAIGRMQNSKAKSKVVILLTDGSNNMGDVSPLTAADIAKSMGIRVYTIGVGSNDVAAYPLNVGGIIQDVKIAVEIDEKTLKQIAEQTDGKYYRATSLRQLAQIYKDIDQLEKNKFEKQTYTSKQEAYLPFMILALILLLIKIFLQNTWFRFNP